MRLSELKVGDKAEVTAVKAESATRRRIMDKPDPTHHTKTREKKESLSREERQKQLD